MEDPRVKMGYEVVKDLYPPYETVPAKRTSPDLGGTLDTGIIACLPDGRQVVIGEIWAMARGPGDNNTRIDARAVAKAIVGTLNEASALAATVNDLHDRINKLEEQTEATDGKPPVLENGEASG
jgi:hypothetical protein